MEKYREGAAGAGATETGTGDSIGDNNVWDTCTSSWEILSARGIDGNEEQGSGNKRMSFAGEPRWAREELQGSLLQA